MIAILDEIARRKAISKSDIIREALNQQIDQIRNLGSGRVVSFRIKEYQLREIDKLARKYHATRTDIIHSKIFQYLKKEGITIG